MFPFPWTNSHQSSWPDFGMFPPRCVWTWSGFSTSSRSLLWALWLCWTFSPGNLSPCPANWSSQTWMTPARKKPPVRQTQTAPSSFQTETLLCPAQIRECVKAWTRRWTFTMPIGKKSDSFTRWQTCDGWMVQWLHGWWVKYIPRWHLKCCRW